jgi:hypothetical protein
VGFSELFGEFILSHRRSGMAIRSWDYQYEKRSDALRAARKIMGFPEWKKVGRSNEFEETPPGFTKTLARQLGKKLDAALNSRQSSA